MLAYPDVFVAERRGFARKVKQKDLSLLQKFHMHI
jgi:hypothetical protein